MVFVENPKKFSSKILKIEWKGGEETKIQLISF